MHLLPGPRTRTPIGFLLVLALAGGAPAQAGGPIRVLAPPPAVPAPGIPVSSGTGYVGLADLPLSDPRLRQLEAAIDCGFLPEAVPSISGTTAREWAELESLAAGFLIGCPDADGLVPTVRGSGHTTAPTTSGAVTAGTAGRTPHAAHAGAGTRAAPPDPVRLARLGPTEVELRGAHLFAGETGTRRFADGDEIEEGLHARTRGSVVLEPTSWSHASAELVGGAGRSATRLLVTRAALTLRGRGLRVTLGRQPRWWGPGRLNEVLLTTNARAGDGIELATDGALSIGAAGAIRSAVFLSYLDDGARPTPYPLLFGHRVAWRPRGVVELGVERTIMLGGAGRSERYTPGDVLDILAGRDENRVDYEGHRDTDQKLGLDITLRLPILTRLVPGLRGSRVFFRYAGDDGLDGWLPTRVSHHYGAAFHLDRTRFTVEFLENVAGGTWYWNDEYPAGYTNRGDFLGTDLGGDAKSGRLRLVRALTRSVGLRAELFVDSRGHRYHQGTSDRPEPGARRALYVEAGIALAIRSRAADRVVVEYRFRNPRHGFAYERDESLPRHLVVVRLSGLGG